MVCIVSLNIFVAPRYLEVYDLAWLHFHRLRFLPPFAIKQFVYNHAVVAPLNIIHTMFGTLLFTASFGVIFVLYFWGVRRLPAQISYRYIQLSTLLLGIVYMLIPIVTSQDIISYTAYTRMVIVYHLNPFIATPMMIRHDYVYRFLYWIDQPSAYGPVWLGLSSGLQWFAWSVGARHVLSMEILLRLFALAMFLGSIHLVWLLSGRLLERYGDVNVTGVHTRRLRATLAFAWNPFLLLEASVNAHNDVTVLFLLLLALWCLFPRPDGRSYYLAASALLALAVCIKITYILLLPGLVLFLLSEREYVQVRLLRRLCDALAAGSISLVLIIAIHFPFWDHGLLLHVLRVNPSSSRDINSFYEFGVNIYAYMSGASLRHTMNMGSSTEVVSHYISAILFVVGYVICCLMALVRPRYVNSPLALSGWMAFVWIYYCLVGDPWFWPWYLIIVFGLFALLEAVQGIGGTENLPFTLGGHLDIALLNRAIAVGMFGLYVLWNFYNVLPHYGYRYVSSILIWLAPTLVVGSAVYRLYIRRRTREMFVAR
jgi:hypothetical protein